MILGRISRALAVPAVLASLAGTAASWARTPAADAAVAGMSVPDGLDGLIVIAIDNGPTIVFQRIPGATQVALEELHPVGLVHDPAGITQGTHLVEHLRCMGATASYAPGQSFAELGTLGMCNAETMGDLTHYDIVVPPQSLDLALSVIAERHASLSPDAALIAQEAPRCHAEVDGVLHALRTPGFKFALAAAVQSWRHGSTAATLRSGLGAWAPAEVEAFITASHAPERMTIAVAGDLDPADLEAATRRHFGAAPVAARENGAGASDPLRPIAYSALPAEASVAWDVDSSAVFVLYPPPADPDERLALTLWCAGAHAPLAARFGGRAAGPMVSTHTYPVGELPVLAYLGVPAGADAGQTAVQLAEALEAIAAGPGAGVAQARSMATDLAGGFEQMCGPAAYEQGVRALSGRMGRAQAERYAVGNIALQLSLMVHTFGPDPEARLAALRARDAAWWEGVVRRTINTGRRRVTVLVPAGDGSNR